MMTPGPPSHSSGKVLQGFGEILRCSGTKNSDSVASVAKKNKFFAFSLVPNFLVEICNDIYYNNLIKPEPKGADHVSVTG